MNAVNDSASSTPKIKYVLADCSCICGCKNRVSVPGFSTVLKEHARCPKCSEKTHLLQYPRRKNVPHEIETIEATPLKPLSEEELRASREAREEIDREFWERAWENWEKLLPEKFKNATTEHPMVKQLLSRLQAKESEVASLVITGEIGRGKTWIAIGYASDAIRRRIFHPSEVLFGTESELLASVANSSFGDVEKGLSKFTSGKYRMIVIDDVGRGTWLREDMRVKVFWHVINEQYKRNDLIVITTNLGSKDFKEYIGPAAHDRLLSMTGREGIRLESSHDDMRRITTEKAKVRAKGSTR